MIANFVAILVLVALVVLFAWLTMRAWGSGRKLLRWVGLVLAGLLTLVLTLVTLVGLIGLYRIAAPLTNPVADVKVASTPDQIARGAKLANLCAECDSTTGRPPLDGGKDDFLTGSGAAPLGSLYAPNLTPAGEIIDWSDGEIVRAIREGVHKSGRALIIMPSDEFHNLSD